MLNISYSDTILKAISKIKDKTDKEKIKNINSFIGFSKITKS